MFRTLAVKLRPLHSPYVLSLPLNIRLTVWWWQGQKRVGTKAVNGIGIIIERLP